MKRRLVTICVCLLLLASGGAIVNVAVAWGLAAWRPTGRWGSVFSGPSYLRASAIFPRQKVWTVQRYRYAGVVRTTSYYSSVVPNEGDTSPSPSQLLPPGSGLWIWDGTEVKPMAYEQVEWEVISGWPYLCVGGLKRQVTDGWNPNQTVRHDVLLNGIDLGLTGKFGANLLPLRPIWPGFAINTVFYAAILWLLCVGPGFVRRRIRARRGQCPACAYPIGTNPLCTECGKPVPKRLEATEGAEPAS